MRHMIVVKTHWSRTLLPAVALVLGFSLLSGCGSGTSTSITTGLAPSSTASAPPATVVSFENTWAASVTAVEALGPSRATIVETIEGRIVGGEVAPEGTSWGPQITEADELLDPAGDRARLTVRSSDGSVKTTVVDGREQTSVRSDSLTTAAFVSVSRYISLEPREGLPLPLWAGNAVGVTEGYADLLTGVESGTDGTAPRGTVEQAEEGGIRLSWERTSEKGTATLTLLLDPDLLPRRIEIDGQGEIEGVSIEYSMSIEYQYGKVASFSDSDFVLEVPADSRREEVTYELSLDRPWSEQADWGQYWLGSQVGEWLLTRAQYAIHGGDPNVESGAEPGDEAVFLFYDRPEATSPNETIQVIVRSLRSRQVEDSRTFAEQRVASGDWVRREQTLAGVFATVYSGALEGGPNDRADSVYLFLSDAVIHIQLLAPVDPQLLLEALRRMQ